jgi:hypothetical protein
VQLAGYNATAGVLDPEWFLRLECTQDQPEGCPRFRAVGCRVRAPDYVEELESWYLVLACNLLIACP